MAVERNSNEGVSTTEWERLNSMWIVYFQIQYILYVHVLLNIYILNKFRCAPEIMCLHKTVFKYKWLVENAYSVEHVWSAVRGCRSCQIAPKSNKNWTFKRCVGWMGSSKVPCRTISCHISHHSPYSAPKEFKLSTTQQLCGFDKIQKFFLH